MIDVIFNKGVKDMYKKKEILTYFHYMCHVFQKVSHFCQLWKKKKTKKKTTKNSLNPYTKNHIFGVFFSIFVGYLMPEPSLQKNRSGTI